VIDATGLFVMPGIIDCHSTSRGRKRQRRQRSVSSMVNMRRLNPRTSTSTATWRAASPRNILHGSANASGANHRDQASLGKAAKDLPSKARCRASSGPGRKSQARRLLDLWNHAALSSTRMGVVDVFREPSEAVDYKKPGTTTTARKQLAKGA